MSLFNIMIKKELFLDFLGLVQYKIKISRLYIVSTQQAGHRYSTTAVLVELVDLWSTSGAVQW